MTPREHVINTRRMRYTGQAMEALKRAGVDEQLRTHDQSTASEKPGADDISLERRPWRQNKVQAPPAAQAEGRHVGDYAMTSNIAQWVKDAMASYEPDDRTLDLVKSFSSEFHAVCEKERASASGLHDIDAMELTYQHTLETCAALLLAANDTDDPVDFELQYHASRAGGDDHLKSWGRLLTGLECDPPIIVQFPFYLMMCNSFTLEPEVAREDYVYATLTGVDWARGAGKFSERFNSFEKMARAAVPTLDDTGLDRCFWRVSLAYLRAMNDCENAIPFKAPKKSQIDHGLDLDMVIAARGFDTMGTAYMCRDGAAFMDDEGVDSLVGSAVPNDVMDLHTDIFTGETRNLMRLLYPSDLGIERTIQTMSTVLSSMLCEIVRGHRRARMHNREDARISSTSPPYSFSRARHRRVFATLELYVDKYPQFWDWTWQLFDEAKKQITEAGLAEPLVTGLRRAGWQGELRSSSESKFLHTYYSMIEDGAGEMAKTQPLGVSKDVAPVIRELHSLWHEQLLDATKKPGWGREFDAKSDALLGEAGEILGTRDGVCDDTYRFAIAFGRMSMGLPYVAYHTVAAIIMTFGAIPPNEG